MRDNRLGFASMDLDRLAILPGIGDSGNLKQAARLSSVMQRMRSPLICALISAGVPSAMIWP